MGYIYLLLAIILEIIGSSFLKLSLGFTKLIPTTITIISFIFCFFFLSLSLKNIPLNIAYATWSAVGLILTTIIAVLIFKETINIYTILGIILITSGVIILNLYGAKH